ncbi:hypothetical protein ABZ370_18220 [Streptomyces sp. NPDC005962]|uniref:hypothetical protein n=1 Tax=Streptomyces sp. NPDC005962 TaxID=3154466 RepID=UPI0033D3425C
MPETAPNSKGPAPAQYKPAATEPAPIPTGQVKPEDIATLSIEYRDGRPVIVVSGGTYVPATLMVVDGSDKAAEAPNQLRYIGEFVLHCHILDHEDTGIVELLR